MERWREGQGCQVGLFQFEGKLLGWQRGEQGGEPYEPGQPSPFWSGMRALSTPEATFAFSVSCS